MDVKDALAAAPRTAIQATIREHSHDLAKWQRGEFCLVASEQDPLAFFLAEAVSNVAIAALAPVRTISDTSELPTPALQRGEPYAHQDSQLMGTGAISDACIKDLQSLLAGIAQRQSSPSSPEKA